MSEDKKFRYIGGQAWVDLPEPAVKGMYYWEHYVKREHYDVQPKPKEWEEGRLIIEGVDFEVKYAEFSNIEKVAIPIQPTMKEERKFTLEEGRVVSELLEAFKEVVRISDRKHDAWDRAKEAIKKAETLNIDL